MNILQIIPSFYPATHYGGTIYSALGLCNALAKRGVELRVLTTDTAGPGGRRRLKIEGFPTIFAAGYPVYYCRKWFLHSVSPGMLARMIESIRWADVVHLTAVYSFPTTPVLLICKLLGKPVVWSPRGALQRWEGSTRPVLKRVWEQLLRTVVSRRLILHVTSELEAEESLKIFPGIRTAMISNGVDVPERTRHIPGSGMLRLLFLGRLHPKKGIDNLLSACKMLGDDSAKSWFITLAGSGDPRYTESLRMQIEKLGLSSRVKMIGEAIGNAKEKLFEEADMVVVPSYTENFGMVVAEALARGVAVIASKGTPWQRVEEIGCGLWVENDPASLSKAIDQMSKMPLREMGERGRRWMEREFSWSRVAEEMIRLYESIAARS